MLIFRQSFDGPSSRYTYLPADSRSGEAVIIDPVFEQVRRDAALLQELKLRLLWSLETHIHADHVTSAWLLRRRTGFRIALSAQAGAECADHLLEDGEQVPFGRHHLEVRATPGHTNDCVTYVLDHQSMAFTGDCLLIRGSGRTDFQQGDPAAMHRSIRECPVVTVCRSGARSAQAVTIMQKEGFTKVANLGGGLLRWRADDCPVQGGAE